MTVRDNQNPDKAYSIGDRAGRVHDLGMLPYRHLPEVLSIPRLCPVTLPGKQREE